VIHRPVLPNVAMWIVRYEISPFKTSATLSVLISVFMYGVNMAEGNHLRHARERQRRTSRAARRNSFPRIVACSRHDALPTSNTVHTTFSMNVSYMLMKLVTFFKMSLNIIL
jgi:hypothetical protein